MLRNFIEQQRQIPPVNSTETPNLGERTIKTFLTLTNFMANPSIFPNSTINSLMQSLNGSLTKGSHEEGKIFLGLANKKFKYELSFAQVLSKDNSQYIIFMLPHNFINLVAKNPLNQLLAVVTIASMARDFRNGLLMTEPKKETEKKARAYQAEVLLTLRQMADEESYNLHLNTAQQSILDNYPHGIISIAETNAREID